MRAPNVLTISPALPFLTTFVAALRAGSVVPDAGEGLALADTTIYVPTRRAAQALGDAFLAASGGPAVVLPRILPLGALEATEAPLIFAEPDAGAESLPLPPTTSPIRRRLRLAALIQRWASAVDGALRRVDADGQPITDTTESFRVATSTVDAFALAGDLASLIDEIRIEGVPWRELDSLQMSGFDDYWRITTAFLSIAVTAWPKYLEENGLVDPAQRQIALIDAQARALAEGTQAGPVIAVGSTGTNRATARLLAAIAWAPNGAVVLPGLDRDLDAASWALISGKVEAGQEPSFGHPQAAMARLLPILGIERGDVRPLGEAPADLGLRARVVAEALRPADTTDLWRTFRRDNPQKQIDMALAGVRLVEAADEREEALCLAVAIREVLETPGLTAALITPDRELARRVRGELLRWGLEVDDTGGEPLARRPLGILARLLSSTTSRRLAAREVGALLAHPLAAFGRPRAQVAVRATQLEIAVLRSVGLRDRSPAEIFSEARRVAADPHAHPAQKSLTDTDWAALSALWRDISDSLAPLLTLEGTQGLATWVEAHRRVLAAISAPGDEDEATALDELFDELGGDDGTLRFTAESYDLFFGRLLQEIVLRNTDRPHPRIQILGLLEARLLRVDVVLLGGLDESIWPPQARTDPFLNRPIRQVLGLTPPERRIGQTAHDFEQAMGHQTMVLSRALKRGGAPCVPSRFLLRLEALCGKAWEKCRARGVHTLEVARLLDRTPKAPVAIGRPRPTPPVALRPQALSVTQIETLRRDPYAVYAARILALAPLPTADDELDPSQFGSLMHETLHRFTTSVAANGSETMRRDALLALLRETFSRAIADPTFEAFRWPLIRKSAEVFLAFDAKQRQTASAILTETTGKLALTLTDLSAFTLRARADRLDFHRDGSVTIIDYKTGQPPGNREIEVGFAPQLTLEAAILNAGGFGMAPRTDIRALYLKLGGKDGGAAREIKFENEPFSSIVDRHLSGLHRLLSSFRSVETGYPSRPFPKFAKAHGDYDHLARVREWALTGEEETLP
jgi:ATP-dependent helicase/nuclease subunit B